jgi:chitodextrinase
MRKSLQLLIATALAVLIAAPVMASSAAAQVVTLNGTFSSVHEDALGTYHESDHHFLQVGADQYELQFSGQAPSGETGALVTVTGELDGHTLVVGSRPSAFRIRREGPISAVTSRAAAITSATSSAQGHTVQTSGGAVATAKIAAVLINFTDLHTTPYSTSQVASALSGSSTSVKAFFEEESKGRMTVSGAVFGWYTINATTTACNWTNWVTLGTAAANAAGANLASFTNVMFIFPNTTQCGFAGLGYVPGTVTLLNGTLSVQVMTHELGHNYGLGHANAIDCSVSGTRVSLSSAANCTEKTYADPFGTMGNNALRHNPGSQLGELGWLGASEKVVGAPGNTFTIAPYFSTGATKLVRIPRGDGSYFDLDYRMTYGAIDTFAAGSPAVSGVMIRLGWGTASPTNSPLATQLIDTTPSTATLADAPLAIGRTFTDPVSTISFTTLSVSTLAVQVRVTEGIDPTAPASITAAPAADGSSVALSWGAATDNVAVGGYQISRDGTVLATVGAAPRAFTDAGTAAGTRYTYTVAAVDTSGNAGPTASAATTTPDGVGASPSPSSSATASPDPSASPNPSATPSPTATPAPTASPSPTPNPGDTQAPTAPEPLDGNAAITSVSLSWGASSDDFGVTGYVVTRNGTKVATVTGTSWTDTHRAPKTNYTYTVSAVDTGLNLSTPTTVAVTTKADTLAPTTPRSFRKVRQSGRYATFAWSRASDNVRVVTYLVYRFGRSTPVAHTTGTSIKFRTTRGAIYFVRAVDGAGNRSAISSRVRIRY